MESTVPEDFPQQTQPEFKKPVLVGRVGKLPRKAKDSPESPEPPLPAPPPVPAPEHKRETALPPAVLLKELNTPIPYKEPKWSGLPPEGSEYRLEVLKSGVILEEVKLGGKSFHVFGRLANCDVVMAHPTISRHHAVLQYKAFSGEGQSEQPTGWYLWDCGSTHGTFLNRRRLPAETYVRVRVGHMIKLGCSTRNFVLLGPEWDEEGQSELTVTEMKEKRAEMKAQWEKGVREAVEKKESERREEELRREESGIDWGMGEDAVDEQDLSENPFASTANEQLYLDDPKKTLRGYFEREGLELTYDCQERGAGQFVCRVSLPIDTAHGQSLVAEAVHRGKKKEAVIACALEACRILDRHGLLRQAKHEPRRRRQRDSSDSDDDTFYERTGDVERRKQRRSLRADVARETLTHAALVEKCSDLQTQISALDERLAEKRGTGKSDAHTQEGEEDELDRFMSGLASGRQSASVQADISKLKSEIAQLKSELVRTERLADISRPASLPNLLPTNGPADTSRLQMRVGTNSVVYGKRLKLKQDTTAKVKKQVIMKTEEEFVEEVDSDEEMMNTADAECEREVIDKALDSGGSADRIDSNETNAKSKDKETGGKTNSEKDNTNVMNEEKKCIGAKTKTENETKRDDAVSKKDNTQVVNDEKKHFITKTKENEERSRVYGPMRPPEDYVMPEGYFTAESDRDEQEVMEDD